MRRVPAVLVAAALIAALPAGAYGAKAKRGLRCPSKAEPKRSCPQLRKIVPIRADGTVTLDTSLKAFAATVAPLPGVRPPKGGYPYIRSASGPIRWVLRHWSKLTPALRAAVQKAVPGLAAPQPAPATRRAPPGVTDPAAGPRARATKLTLADLQKLAEEGRAKLNKHFDPDLTIAVTVAIEKVWKYADAGAYAEPLGGCRIAFPTTVDKQVPYLRETLLHELTHCYLFQLSPNQSDAPPWVAEGAAEWVAAVVSPEWIGPGYVSPDIQNDWKAYFANFTAPLTQHAYTAMPYYGQLARSGSQPQVFQTLTAMFKTAQPSKDAYGVFVDASAAAQEFLTTIASSGTRLAPLGERWEADGPMIPSVTKARYNPPSASVGAGTLSLQATAYGRTVVGLNPVKGADYVKLEVGTPGSAWGLLHHADGDYRLQDGDAFFCARAECKCPDGRKIQPLGEDSYLALYAHKKQAKVRLERATVKEACAQTPSAMTVTGAFNMTVTEQGACNLRSKEMGAPGKKLGALWTTGYSPSRPQGVGQVVIRVDGNAPGAYLSDIDKPGPYGHAQVTKYGEPGGQVWSDDNPPGQPVTRYFGVVNVSSVNADGATGTVDIVLKSSPPSQVRLRGRWSCAPYDKILPSNS